VIQIIVDFAEEKPYGIKLTDKDWKAEDQQLQDNEVAHFEDVLADRGRSNLFAFENSVFHDSTKVFK